MSQRERQTGGTIAPVPRPATPSGSPVKPPESVAEIETSSWEGIFAVLSPQSRNELIELAEKQGFLLRQQLPSATPQRPTDAFRNSLNSIRTDPLSLPAFPLTEPISAIDPHLDAVQQDVVSRALRTPDLFLIQGLPATGKTRVIAEIVRQAARSKLRVLLVAPRAMSVDAVLARMPEVDALRVLARGEKSEGLPAAISTLTLESREREFKHRLVAAAQNEVDQLVNRLDGLKKAQSITLNSLEGSIGSHFTLEASIALSARSRENVPAEVHQHAERISILAETSPFLDELRALAQSHGETLAGLDAEKVELRKQTADQDQLVRQALTECEHLRPLLELREQGHWWSITAWKAKRDKTLPERCAQAEARCKDAEETLQALARSEASLEERRAQADSEYAAKRAACIATEIGRRQEDLAKRETELLQERAGIDASIENAFKLLLEVGVTRPADWTVDMVDRLRQQVADTIGSTESKLERASQWRNLTESESDRIIQRMRGSFALVAGPISALTSDHWFTEATGRDTVFDVLIVDETQRLSEAELVPLTRKAKRWVLVGEPAWPIPELSPRLRASISQSGVARAQPAFMQRLWDLLHQEIWVTESDRLCCRLQSISLADRTRLDREFVADQPDIELRIFTPGNGIPTLAEIVFPERMNLAQAKEYLCREVGEIAIQLRCRSVSWRQENDTLLALFESTTPSNQLALGDGVKELLCERYTIGFAFDSNQWDPARAASWLEKQVSARSSNRSANLATPYRATAPLAAWLNEAVYHGAGYAVPTQTSSKDAIQFEAVPERIENAGGRSGRQRESRNGDRPNRGGAGFELDIADPRQRERLPRDIAPLLPAHGLVNIQEAHAVCDLLSQFAMNDSVIVTASTLAQVALLRHLAPRPSRVQFLPMAEVADQECDVLIIGLTRSHVSRAVTYGEDPSLMIRAMTRVRRRIVLVGDPGTLARRAQWEGAVDHLDEISGERERTWVKALLRHVPSRVLHPTPARVPEGVKA